MMSKICPFLSDANIRHECTEKCALSCVTHDYNNDGQAVNTYDKCAFKEMIYELAKMAHCMNSPLMAHTEVK